METAVIDNPSRGIALYLLVAFGLSSLFWALIIATGHVAGGGLAYATGLMWCPGIAALLCCRILGLDYRRLGWGWGEWRWQRLAYLVPLGYTAVAYGAVWLTGLGKFPHAPSVLSIRQSLGWPHSPASVVVGGYFLLTASTALVPGIARALGEEIGWRGFLAPRMHRAFGFTGGAVLTGLIWALWHLPILLFADYNSRTPRWFALPCFAILAVAMSIPMAWLRLRSGSVWTAAVFHASHDLFVQGFFTRLTGDTGPITRYAVDEFGFALPLAATVAALYFWRRRRAAMGGRD